MLVYELGFSGQYYEEEEYEAGLFRKTDKLIIRDFSFVAELLDQRIKEIEAECWANEPPTLFLTNDRTLNKQWNRLRKIRGEEPIECKPNFRTAIAEAKVYKGQRTQEKPFHRDNIRAYMLSEYDVVVANGMEADDMLAITQTNAPPLTTIICTRDKDLRMVKGMHYGWPCGKQLAYGPKQVEGLGELELNGTKLTGTGCKFFYSQVLTGDSTDNYPGLPRCGPAGAFKLLEGKQSEAELFEAVSGAYRDKFGDGWEEKLIEQARLAWMVVETDDQGEPVMWECPPQFDEERADIIGQNGNDGEHYEEVGDV